MTANLTWFALRVAPHAVRPILDDDDPSFGCEHGLRRAGVAKVWVPFGRKKTKLRHGTATVWIRYPIISTYVFVASYGLEDLWNRLWRVPIVQTIIGIRGWPRAIEQQEIDNLRSEIVKKRLPRSVGAHQPFHAPEIGDRGILNHGAFAGHPVIVEELRDDNSAARVLLHMFGAPTRVWIQLDNITFDA